MGGIDQTAGEHRLTPADRRAIEQDEVVHAHRLTTANPGLSITTPRQNGTPEFLAVWTDEADEVVGTAHHYDLRTLLDHLIGKHGFQDVR